MEAQNELKEGEEEMLSRAINSWMYNKLQVWNVLIIYWMNFFGYIS